MLVVEGKIKAKVERRRTELTVRSRFYFLDDPLDAIALLFGPRSEPEKVREEEGTSENMKKFNSVLPVEADPLPPLVLC